MHAHKDQLQAGADPGKKNSWISSLFSMTLAAFHDFPGLENGLTKFHDFPGRVSK